VKAQVERKALRKSVSKKLHGFLFIALERGDAGTPVHVTPK
jgi:hypothetical protein